MTAVGVSVVGVSGVVLVISVTDAVWLAAEADVVTEPGFVEVARAALGTWEAAVGG